MLTLAAFALFGLGGPPKPPTHFQDRVGAWAVDYRKDLFADRLACSLFTGRRERGAAATFEAGRIVIHFAKDEDTGQAVYRLDGGAPRSAAGGLLHRPLRYAEIGTLESATGGLVFIPASEVEQARRLEIRPNAKAGVRRFEVAGLAGALAKARAQGCRV